MDLQKAHGKTEKLLTQPIEGVKNFMQLNASWENSPKKSIWREF